MWGESLIPRDPLSGTWMTFIYKILCKLFYLRSFIANNPLKAHPTELAKFHAFNDGLRKKTNTQLEHNFHYRFADIQRVVNKYDIRNIVEIGTGRTTFFFNALPGIRCISIEQDESWMKIVDELLTAAGMNAEIYLSSVSAYRNGAKFDNLPELYPELLYIDAPYFCNNGGKKGFSTYTGKPAFYDFETILSRGVRPKVIMIEGRTDTADAMLMSEFSKEYTFTGEFIYCVQREKYLSSMRFARHSLFVHNS